jgi:hypothetical protein
VSVLENLTSTAVHWFGIVGFGRGCASWARFYDAAVNRWWNIDPEGESEEQSSWNPYHYVMNNPVKNIDPDGREGESVTGGNDPWIPYNPLYYMAEGFRQYFQASAETFSFKAEVHSNTVTESKQKVGNVEVTQSVTDENKAEFNINASGYFKTYGRDTELVRIKTETKTKVEVKASIDVGKVGPTTASVSVKNETSKSGNKTTVAAGLKMESKSKNNKGEANIEVSRTREANGKTKMEVKAGVDYTRKITEKKQGDNKKVTVSQKTGGSISKEF